MNNNDERDYAEEAYNLATMREQDEPAAEPVRPAVADLVELVEQNMGADRLVSDAADFFTDPGGVLGYLLSPARHETDGLDEAAREAFRVVARKHAGDLDDCGQAARHYLATGQAWTGEPTPATGDPDLMRAFGQLAGSGAPDPLADEQVAELLRGLSDLARAWEDKAGMALDRESRLDCRARSATFRQAHRMVTAYLRPGAGDGGHALAELLPRT